MQPLLQGILCLCLMILCDITSAQNMAYVSGTIREAESSQPISDASISLKRTGVGTISNNAGRFQIYYSLGTIDTLMITHLGYKTLYFEIQQKDSSNIDVGLVEAPTVLNEIIVGDTISAGEIIRRARVAAFQRYSSTPALMRGFHRSWEKVAFGDSIVPGTLIECAVSIYDPGHAVRKGREKFSVDHVRRTNLQEGWNYAGNWLNVLLRENQVRHPNTKVWFVLHSFLDPKSNFKFVLSGVTSLDGEELFEVSAVVPNDRHVDAMYRIYISTIDYAVMHYELCGTTDPKDLHLPWTLDSISYRYWFTRIDDVIFLQHAIAHYTISKWNAATHQLERSEEYFRELMVNQLIVDDVVRLSEASGWPEKSQSIALSSTQYDAEFWKTYNVIQDNPLDVEIRKIFEKRADLESQFSRPSDQKRSATSHH